MANLDELLKPILVEGLLKTINWYKSDNSHYLRSIFNQIGFKDGDKNEDVYYMPPVSLSSKIICPVVGNIDILEKAKKEVLLEINKDYQSFSRDYLNSLNSNQLLFLLEKFGGNVPLDDTGLVSVFDAYKIKAAREVIQLNRKDSGHNRNLFINIDLSGIQGFIYNITSRGALKNLRSRSFFIEVLCNHIIYRVLESFHLHYVNILMNGGGNIYILSSCPDDYQDLLDEINYSLNKWLLEKFNGRLHTAFSSVICSDEKIEKDMPNILEQLSKDIFIKKQRKFRHVSYKLKSSLHFLHKI